MPRRARHAGGNSGETEGTGGRLRKRRVGEDWVTEFRSLLPDLREDGDQNLSSISI